MNKNKKWYLVDIKNGDLFDQELEARSQQEAISMAIAVWDSLSEHDRKLRSDFWIAQYGLGEDGIDYNSEEFFVNILDIVR